MSPGADLPRPAQMRKCAFSRLQGVGPATEMCSPRARPSRLSHEQQEELFQAHLVGIAVPRAPGSLAA